MAPRYAGDQPSGFNNAIKNVAIVGATGQVGKVFTEYLVNSIGKQTVTAITRAGSTTTVPAGVRVAHVDYNDKASLAAALTGQDFLVITLALSASPDTHGKLVKAAAKAVVNSDLQNDIPALGSIYASVKEVEEVGVNWIGITPNFWYEYSMGVGPFTFGFDFPNKTVTFYDDGKSKVNTTTWPQIGRALAALVNLKKLPEDENDRDATLEQFCNKPLYISSFTLNQRQLLDSVNGLLRTSDADWNILYQPAAERFKEGFEELGKGNGTGFLKALYARIFYPTGEGVYETQNETLGLSKEDLTEATKAAHEWALSQAKQHVL